MLNNSKYFLYYVMLLLLIFCLTINTALVDFFRVWSSATYEMLLFVHKAIRMYADEPHRRILFSEVSDMYDSAMIARVLAWLEEEEKARSIKFKSMLQWQPAFELE